MDKQTSQVQGNIGDWTGLSDSGADLLGLGLALRRLDRLLQRAVALAQAAYGAEAAADPYRGLYISGKEVEQLLARPPGAPLLWDGEDTPEEATAPFHPASSRLAWLQQIFHLSPFDLDVIILALAPEMDLRYERLYAFLQDNVSKRRPTVDLALQLLCAETDSKLQRRTHFAADAPLIWHRVVHLNPTGPPPDPLLSRTFRLDEQILDFILGHDRLDSRLARFCHLVQPIASLEPLPLPADTWELLTRLVLKAGEPDRPLRLYFQGPRGVGKGRTAATLAGVATLPLLIADLAQVAPDTDFRELLSVLFREAWFRDAVLLLEQIEGLQSSSTRTAWEGLLEHLATAPGVVVMTGSEPWAATSRQPLGVISVPLPLPAAAQRRLLWQAQLEAAGLTLGPAEMDALAGRFRLTPAQMAEALAVTWQRLPRQAVGDAREFLAGELLGELLAAVRAQCGHDLAKLARKITPVYTWDDIVLPEEARAQLREICQRVAGQEQVLEKWGFGAKLSLGKGINALFVGPSGTGKTMAAEIIAQELQLDLYKIDLSGVVSKYIGETEKNLDRIFTAAENANAILLFDEADALFGKRSEVRDSHDRYANIEVSYLLQKMEQFEGITILATNLRQNLDEAFVRRLAFTVHFPSPGEADRRRIWEGIWPSAVPLGQDVDLAFLARQFKLTGGNIKNIALAAAFLAARNGTVISQTHLLQATRREFQKLGKALSEVELRGAGERQTEGGTV